VCDRAGGPNGPGTWADGGYTGRLTTWAKEKLQLTSRRSLELRRHQGFPSAVAEVHSESSTTAETEAVMLLLGIILLVVGFVTGISILWTIGIILAVIGAVLWIMGSVGHAVAGRRHYW
jgi:fatty acid desaturase